MNIDSNLTITGRYKIIQASIEDIALFIMQQIPAYELDPDRFFPRILESLQKGTWALDTWLTLSRQFAMFPDPITVWTYKNLVPNTLKYSLATLLSGTTVSPTFKVKYIALGTGSATPAASDTQLQTETVRGAIAQSQAINNVAYFSTYFGSAQVAGNTYLEAGMFVDGTASANTGYLLSHVAINQAIGSNQSLTINSSITLN